jgi:hypothetical protein
MPGKGQRMSPGIASILCLFALLQCSPLQGSEQEQAAILLGGYFERPPVYRYLPGSRKTIIYPAMIGRYNRTNPLPNGRRLSSKEWDRLIKETEENSMLQLATITPEMIRDKRGVIQMAVISTDDPTTANLILLPAFLQHFSAIFGSELIIAIPSRNKIYVFPKLANQISKITELILDDYRISPMPVSTELFELSSKGLRAIGDCNPNHD